ncbi:L-gulonolactone oxidase 5 [Cryptomeria japonica]|uniref:L-gulonolactone oxidase 5 n=1 Tax=Cryptomeria japonica TaxID=3369 RepID=UPI0027D9F9BE|nr:L-gulonolactone oxidase 5 [Cryptomeria japonica]
MELKTCIVVIYSMIVVVFLSSRGKCSPPGPVVECSSGLTDCVVTNSYGAFSDRSICKAAQAVFPSTEEELLASVANAVKKQQKIRVVSKHSHSIPKLVCPEGDSGLIISSKDLNHVVSVDESSMRMTVESGMGLKDLIDSAAEHGLALPHSPYWLGVSVGGMLGTGAHGSSLFGKGSAVHEYVVGIRLVVPASQEEGYARVATLTEQDMDLNAAKVSLGVLGVISQVTFQLEPMFKRSITNVYKSDFNIENSIVKFGLEHEFADLTWYPSQYKVVYRVDDRLSINSSGDGVNDFIGFQPQSTALLATTRAAEEAKEATSNGEGKCILSAIQVSTILSTGAGLKNNNLLFTGYPVIGYQNKMQSAGSCLTSSENGLLTSCAWDPRIKGLFFHQTGMSISVSRISEFLSDVKKLRDMNPISKCGLELYSGILMRFVKASSAHLGKEEDSVDMDITYYRSNDPNTPRLYEDVFEEIEQMGFFKYGALPHWGKNRNLAFDGVIKKYSKSNEFLSAKNKYDPQGIFSSEWTDSLLELKDKQVTVSKDGCALEGLCVCSKDAHCAPDRGYFCEAGKVYTDARVCRG